MPAHTIESEAAVARRQHGCIDYSQLRAGGWTDDRIERAIAKGELIRSHPSILRFAGAPRTDHQHLMEAALWAASIDKGVVAICDEAAAWLWKIPGWEWSKPSVAAQHNLRAPKGVTARRRKLDPSDVVTIDGIPATGAERLIVDLAARASYPRLCHTLDHLLRQEALTLPSLMAALARLGTKGRRGIRKLFAAIEARLGSGGPAHSEAERRLEGLLRAAGHTPERQFAVPMPGGYDIHLDFAFSDAKVAVEVDGYRWHGQRSDWERDRQRDRSLRELGWVVLRFSWDEIVLHPEYVLAEVAKALLERFRVTQA